MHSPPEPLRPVEEVRALLRSVDAKLQICLLLMQHGSWPLRPSSMAPVRSFLSGGPSPRPLGAPPCAIWPKCDVSFHAPRTALHPLTLPAPCPRPCPPSLPPAACQDPALLRLAVNFVRDHSARSGRQLSDWEARVLVDAAGRAFLGGF